jgi:hypothetical protein
MPTDTMYIRKIKTLMIPSTRLKKKELLETDSTTRPISFVAYRGRRMKRETPSRTAIAIVKTIEEGLSGFPSCSSYALLSDYSIALIPIKRA